MVTAFVSMMDSMITLPAEFITAIVIASLCTSMPTNFVLSIIRCSFLLEANAQNLPQKGRTLIMRSRKGNPKEIWAKQQFAIHRFTGSGQSSGNDPIDSKETFA